ncbi:MAG: 2-oxoacid:acceptor oxidoreductase family protein [Nitrospiria bacterium]
MLQIRIHGRGGQGVITAAELLSIAAFIEGKFSQAFPSFGSERMGAPVMAFCRISDNEIRLREPVLNPDVLIIQDPTLLHQVDLFSGLNGSGYVLINSAKSLEGLGIKEFLKRYPSYQFCAVPATELALENIGRPLPNAALLGGFSALTGNLKIDSVKSAIRERWPGLTGESNAKVAESAYEYIIDHQKTLKEI